MLEFARSKGLVKEEYTGGGNAFSGAQVGKKKGDKFTVGGKTFTKEEEIEKTTFEERIENICQTASDNKVPLFIDAEESWIQGAIDDIAIKMMQKFNKNEAWIYNTLQLYRNDRIDHLEMLFKLAAEEKFFVGLKLVRGAYHEQEIERAKEKGYEDTKFICLSWW